jgi:hypothetical protein
MTRIVTLFATSCALAVVFGATDRTASAKTVQITQEVADGYQKYLKENPGTAATAFIVTADGTDWWTDRCDPDECKLTQLVSWLKSDCETKSNQHCILMDTNRDLKVEYTVTGSQQAALPNDTAGSGTSTASNARPAPATPPAASAPASDAAKHVLTPDEFKKLIVGNSITGILTSNGARWTEYYDPNGELRGFDTSAGVYVGKYRQRDGNMVCFTFADSQYDDCDRFRLNGDKIEVLMPDGEIRPGSRDTKLLKGNPQQL